MTFAVVEKVGVPITGLLTSWGAGLLELADEAGHPIPCEALRADGARAQPLPGIRWASGPGAALSQCQAAPWWLPCS